MSSSPWGKIQQVEAVNLDDIMSEEFAKDLQEKENKKYEDYLKQFKKDEFTIPDDIPDVPVNDTPESDAVIAQILQKQYDKEHDESLKRFEDNFNGSSKVSISYSNYRRTDDRIPDSDLSSDEELVDVVDRKDWDRFDKVERSVSSIPRCGYVKQDGNMVTKHDITLSGRKNACKFMSFPPEFQTGDGAGFDLQLSNRVFNSLRAHSNKEQSRRHKIHDKKEDHATAELGVDEFTRLLLYKLINNEILEQVNGVISTGKEAVILHADASEQRECVVKVFKTTLSEFKQRDKYIKDDHRFKDRYGKPNSRKMVQLWAEKEMHNLMRLSKIGLACPEVIQLKKHVLVMSFIGANHKAAPKLKDARLNDAEWILAYEEVVDAMKKLYSEAKLIHADLSEYNILWYDDKCWFIDVSQSVEPTHPNAFYFLFRDCTNISNFFNKQGVPEVKNPNELFTLITGHDYSDKRVLLNDDTVRIKPKPHLIDDPDKQTEHSFDFDWDNSKKLEQMKINISANEDTPVL